MKELKEKQNVWILIPDYPLGQIESTDRDIKCGEYDLKIIYKVTPAVFVGYKRDPGRLDYPLVLIDGQSAITEVYDENIYLTEGSAEYAVKKHNKNVYIALGERVSKLEKVIKDIEDWAKNLSKK